MKRIINYLNNALNYYKPASIEEAFDVVCSEMQKVDWWVVRKREDLLTYTFAKDYSEVNEGESDEINLGEFLPHSDDYFYTPIIRITEFYKDSGSDDFVYLVEAIDKDNEIEISSIE